MAPRDSHDQGQTPWHLLVVACALAAATSAERGARALWSALDRLPGAMERAESVAVPALAAVGGGTARAAGTTVDALARGLLRLAHATTEVVGATTHEIAGGVLWLARAILPRLLRVEGPFVDALAATARMTALGVGAAVDGVAQGAAVAGVAGREAGVRAWPPLCAAGRACAAALRVAGHACAAASLAAGRWARVWVPRMSLVAAKTAALGTLGVLLVVAITVPALRVAASTVDLDTHPSGGDVLAPLTRDQPGRGDTASDADARPAAGEDRDAAVSGSEQQKPELPPLEERSTIYAADGSPLATLHGDVNRRVVDLDAVPDHVIDAIVAAEDHRFYEHDGYDLEAIGRALRSNVSEWAIVEGGSTITQQLAKQNYVGNEQVLSRKVKELIHAIALEDHFSKEQLLERYVNQVYFGAGAYGIAAAAEEWFGVQPAELGVEDAALLAGMIRSPNALDPRRDPEAATERRNRVLQTMAAEGHLEQAEADELAAIPVEVLPERPQTVREPHVVEAVKREFLADPAFGETREQRARLLLAGGLDIHTTVEPRLQAAAGEAVTAMLGPGGPVAAIASVDPRTGQVRALHSGADFTTEQFDYAAQGRRQPGSAFKPFVLAAALERGMPLSATLDGTSPSRLDVPGQQRPWRVHNYDGASYGPVTAEEALERSVNTAFADLILDTGTDPVVELASQLGIDPEEAFGPESSRGPSIALGGLTRGVSPLQMATAYGAFANDGVGTKPYIIQKITDRSGRALFTREPKARRVLGEDTNAAMVQALEGVVDEGTGTKADLDGWQVIGKTGTTQQNADAWFVGAVPGMSTAVWIGHPGGQTPIPGLTGGSLPAPMWRRFMQQALEGEKPRQFTEPPDEASSANEE